MKKFIIFSSVIALSLILLAPVLAKDFSLPDISLTPDNPFYFLKSWKESIQTFFTFGLENKAKQYLHLAGVRLAEYQKMMEIGKIEIAGKTLNKYQDQLNRALEKANELKQQGKDIKDLTQGISQIIPQSLEILQNNLQKVPEQARKGIENAIENSKKVIGNILGNQTEKACTQEAKICPDGTAVGRSGPNCEFGPCPEINNKTANSSTTLITGWQTYRNEEYGFEVKYPKEWTKQNENQDNVEFLSSQDIEARKNPDPHFHTFSMNISVDELGKNETFEMLMQKRFGLKDLNEFKITPEESNWSIDELKKVFIGNNIQSYFVHAWAQAFPLCYYVIKNNNTVLEISRDGRYECLNSQQFNQILSTFKFIK